MRHEHARLGLHELAFGGTVLLAGLLVWVAHRPPMGDIPGHASQVLLLSDLLGRGSPWADLVHVHWFTPYLVGYGLAALLSLALPALTALKLVLTGAYYAFVAACVALRRSLGGDRRLDWLFVPGFFGLSYQFGFYTFLVAAPLGLLFVLAARRFVEAPTSARAAAIVAAGVVLFFCHGLVFLFACSIGVGFLLLGPSRRPSQHAAALVPYAVLGVLSVTFFVYVQRDAATAALPDTQPGVSWDWGHSWGWHRLPAFVAQVFAATGHEPLFLLVGAVLAAAPWVLGARPNRRRMTWVPALVVLAIWLLVPSHAMKTSYLYHRFTLFLFPAYAWVFAPRPADSPALRWAALRGPVVEVALAAACWLSLGVIALREHRFVAESAPFEEVLAAARPGEKALGLVYSPASAAMHNPYVYDAYYAYYQVDAGGWVDPNFACFLPQIVRFRPGRVPPATPGVDELPVLFDWKALQARRYRYIFVRKEQPLPASFFDNDECEVVLAKRSGDWSLYERVSCVGGPASP
jgi:hypothetical protein